MKLSRRINYHPAIDQIKTFLWGIFLPLNREKPTKTNQEGGMGEGKRANRITSGCNKEHHRGNQNAQAIVELALILPILLVLIVGALEFGRLWSTKIVLTNAAREGAYYYASHSSSTNCSETSANSVIASQNEAINSGLSLSSYDISIDGSSCTPGTSVNVTTTTTVDNLLILGFVGNVFHLTGSINSFTLSSSVEMMVQ
jgi:hypothetical protein